MKVPFFKIKLTLVFFLIISTCFADFYKLDFIVRNQPDRLIVLGLVKGDEFIPVDSTLAKNELVQFRLPEKSVTGMYRIILEQSADSQSMDEEPQMFDFIFNNEHIIIETDYCSPEESVNVILSNENRLWYYFKRKINAIDSDIAHFEKRINGNKVKYNNEIINWAQQHNLLQLKRKMFLDHISRIDSSLFATQMIKSYKSPLMDGYLTEKERKDLFQKEFFKVVDFENEALIYTQCYTNNILNYLVSYNDINLSDEQREKAFKKAINIILANTGKNKTVYNFIVTYMKRGFVAINMKSLADFISSQEKI